MLRKLALFAAVLCATAALGQTPQPASPAAQPDSTQASAPQAPTAAPSSNTKQPALPRHDEQLVVTGSYAAVPMEETDRSVSTIPVEQSPVVFRNWADALEQEPSLDVQQRAPGTSADLSIRGATFGESLILVNGLRLNDVQTGHNNLDLPFPFAAVERIEVLKGAGSTLYGSDAMGGAVNFITAVPTRSEFRLGAAMGNFGTNLENGVASWVRPHFSQQLTFLRELSSGFTADRNYRNLAFGAETVFTTAAGRSDVLLGLSDRPYGAAGFYGVPSSIPSFERDKAWFAAWSQAIDKQTSASFAYRRHTDEYIYTLQDPSAYENNHIGEDWQASLRRDDRLAANTRLYYGADALREHIDSNSLGIHTRDQAGFYLSLDARSLRRFSLTAGVREELYTAGRQVFSPSISGAYWLTSRLKLHASASHAFRLPDYTELYYTDPIHLNDPNLKPETSWSYEGGVQLTLQRGLTAEATVFQHRDRDVIDYARPSTALPTTPYTAGNIDSLNFTGAELSLRWQLPQRQKIELAYSELHGDSSAPAGLAYLYSFNYPVHSGVATWWSHTPFGFDSRFRVAALERYGQSPYPLVEWAVSREFHWSTHYVTPYVQLTNMTNTKYQEISGVAMPGRGFVAGLELHWRER